MKRQTKAQKCSDLADAIKCINQGKPPKRSGAKDGSIATHPVVNVHFDYSEKIVLGECLAWLNRNHIFHNRHDSGSFQNNRGQWGTYGIKSAGDIIGLLPTGQHFEIECKRGHGGRLLLGQQKRMRSIRANGGLYFVIHGVEELECYFKEYLK